MCLARWLSSSGWKKAAFPKRTEEPRRREANLGSIEIGFSFTCKPATSLCRGLFPSFSSSQDLHLLVIDDFQYLLSFNWAYEA